MASTPRILLLAAVVAAVTACGPAEADAPVGASAPPPSGALIERDCEVPVDVFEVNGEADLAGLLAAADLVVRGRVTDLEDGVRLEPEAPDMEFAVLDVEPEQVVKGEPGATTSVAITSASGGCAEVVPGRVIPEPGDDAVWFLSAVESEDGRVTHIPLGSAAVLALDADGVVANEGGDQPALVEARDLGDVDAVLDALR